MSDVKVFPVKPEFAKNAWINAKALRADVSAVHYRPRWFWRKEAQERIDWIKPFTKVRNASFNEPVSIKWFEDSTPTPASTASTAIAARQTNRHYLGRR